MARVFLLYLLGVYLFTNGGKTVSLRWLALFQEFERAWATNWGRILGLLLLLPGYSQSRDTVPANGALKAP